MKTSLILLSSMLCMLTACEDNKTVTITDSKPSPETKATPSPKPIAKPVKKQTLVQKINELAEKGQVKQAHELLFAQPDFFSNASYIPIIKSLDPLWVSWVKDVELPKALKDNDFTVMFNLMKTIEEWNEMAKAKSFELPEELKNFKKWPIRKQILKKHSWSKISKRSKDAPEGTDKLVKEAVKKVACQNPDACEMVTLKELQQQWSNNELKAEKLYGEGKGLVLKATVKRVRKTVVGQVVIELESSKKKRRALNLPVQAYLKKDSQQGAAELNPKDKVFLTCTNGARKSMHLQLIDCAVVPKSDIIAASLRVFLQITPITPPASYLKLLGTS